MEYMSFWLPKGLKLKIPIYKFLKNALIRKFGTDWYNLLTKIVEK